MLLGAQVMLWGAAGAFAAFGPIGIFELSQRETLVGVLLGLYFVGVAAGAPIAGRLMDRAGRRPGLAAGYAAMGLAGAGAFAAMAMGSVPWLLAMGPLTGLGAAAALLGRTAVADMYPAARRGRAVGTLVVAGTIGAIGGPPAAGLLVDLARRSGLVEPLAAPWLLFPLLSAVALLLVLSLRPDPRDLAVEATEVGVAGRRPIEILRMRPGAVAVLTIAVAQAVMVHVHERDPRGGPPARSE